MKKFILIVSMVTIAAGFTACTKTPVDSTEGTTIEASVDGSEETSKEDTNATTEGASKDSADVDASKLLIPENAENVVEVAGATTYTTTDSQEDVVTFYGKAIKALDAKQTEVVDSSDVSIASIEGVEGVPQAWVYIGTYGADDTPINISVLEVPGAGMVQVTLIY